MQKTIIVGAYAHLNLLANTRTPGHLMIKVTDVAPGDLAKQKNRNGTQVEGLMTIAQLKEHFGGTQGYLVHPIGQYKFLFDLGPWADLDAERYLRIDWFWTREYSSNE